MYDYVQAPGLNNLCGSLSIGLILDLLTFVALIIVYRLALT